MNQSQWIDKLSKPQSSKILTEALDFLIGEHIGEHGVKLIKVLANGEWVYSTGKYDRVETDTHNLTELTEWVQDMFFDISKSVHDLKLIITNDRTQSPSFWHFDEGSMGEDAHERQYITTYSSSNPVANNGSALAMGMNSLHWELIEEWMDLKENDGLWCATGEGSSDDIILCREMKQSDEGENVAFHVTEGGRLHIVATEEGRNLIQEDEDVHHDLWDLAEDIFVNSEIQVVNADDLGHLSGCTCLLYGWGLDDDGGYVEYPDSSMYTNINWYQIVSITERLLDGNCVFVMHDSK